MIIVFLCFLVSYIIPSINVDLHYVLVMFILELIVIQPPMKELLENLLEGKPLKAGVSAVCFKILTPGQFNRRPNLRLYDLLPGDSVSSNVRTKLITLSEFTFPTLTVYRTWENTVWEIMVSGWSIHTSSPTPYSHRNTFHQSNLLYKLVLRKYSNLKWKDLLWSSHWEPPSGPSCSA